MYSVVGTIKGREVMVNEARYFNQKPGYFYAGHPIQNEEWFEPFAEGLMLSYSRKYDATGNSEF